MTRRSLRGVAVASAGIAATAYDADCRRCARLAAFLDVVRAEHPHYFCRPVAPFGAADARLVIVGLAPGMHGANATGRPFTGDYAGILLYATLFKFGFATHPETRGADDGLRLIDARITNAVKCLPPGNKPQPAEVRRCNAYLTAELSTLPADAAVLALGRVAHDAALRALGLPLRGHAFAHGAEHTLERGMRLFDSYHCSRYNTNTGRLTTAMFEQVFAAITRHLRGERTATRIA
ncbi:MAG: uracil-DNA glycosylase [Pseudomonadota bacterium]|nr:uracil-DNA glycosylase [Pseudomonadota bacterium]